MATDPPRPWENSRWRTSQSPPASPPSSKPLGTLGVLAIALGVGVLGYYMLDGHAHTCEACGHRWRHLGAFNLGDPGAHTCKCGTVQWWKDGVPHVYREALRSPPPNVLPDTIASRMQELRDAPRTGFAAFWPREGSR